MVVTTPGRARAGAQKALRTSLLIGLASAVIACGQARQEEGAQPSNMAPPGSTETGPEGVAPRSQEASTQEASTRGEQSPSAVGWDAGRDRGAVGDDVARPALPIDSGAPALPIDAGAPALPIDAGVVDALPDAAPEPTSQAQYATETWGAALWHLNITKLDPTHGYCVRVLLASPSTNVTSDIDVPAPWALHGIEAIVTDDDCEYRAADGAERLVAGGVADGGYVRWDGLNGYGTPCSVDIDLHVAFPPTDGIPERDHLRASDLPVDCEFTQ